MGTAVNVSDTMKSGAEKLNEKVMQNDWVHDKSEQYDVAGKAKAAASQTSKFLSATVTKLGDLTHKYRPTINKLADKGISFVDQKSGGKYSKHATKVRSLVDQGLDKLAARGSHGTTTEDAVKENIDDYVKPADSAADAAETN